MFAFCSLAFIFACSKPATVSGPVDVKIIKPVSGQRCRYEIAPGRIQTLENLYQLSGAIGKVVTTRENLGSRPEILDAGSGFKPVDLEFAASGKLYGPVNIDTLFAASLYYIIEQGYLMFARLDPSADITKVVPNFKDLTFIVHDARRTFGKIGERPEVHDNAEYLSHKVKVGDVQVVRNYVFSYPTEKVKDMPLGLNQGIMIHEFTHLVFHHLFYEPGFAKNTGVDSSKPTMNTLGALDEGLADYFGFLGTGDPSFFQCSFPSENRDLLVQKSFTDSVIAGIASDSNFDPHEGGAVFAAINYEIGQAIGSHDENAKSLIKLMPSLLTCSSTTNGSNSVKFNFKDVAACHVQVAPAQYQDKMRQIYNARLGSYGGL